MLSAVDDAIRDLLDYIDLSPSPYHAVAETARRLAAAGFRELSERATWELGPGDRSFTTRADGSLIAIQVGSASPADGGFRIVGAHTDSPNLRLKPRADVVAHGYRQLAVEPYGGVLLHTWLDRDLSLAGRVTLRNGDATRTALVDFRRAMLRIPNLAIHLQRELRTDGLKLDAQKHLQPLTGLANAPDAASLVAEELATQGIAAASPEDVLAFDLMT
jgi:aspartyl aminopeptidase